MPFQLVAVLHEARILRRLLGWCWLAGWLVLLRVLTVPWEDLGGVVSERSRWWVKLVSWVTLPLGWLIGCAVRDAAQRGSATHRSALRWVLQPAVWATGAALLWLRMTDRTEPIGIVVLAFAAYWAGLDLSIGIWPLMLGNAYRFSKPIPLDLPDPALDPPGPFGDADSASHQPGDLEGRARDR